MIKEVSESVVKDEILLSELQPAMPRIIRLKKAVRVDFFISVQVKIPFRWF
jgi:hypothetical protein